MGPCIIMLQHEVMVVDEWHNNGPQDLGTVSLCIQNAINKIHLEEESAHLDRFVVQLMKNGGKNTEKCFVYNFVQ